MIVVPPISISQVLAAALAVVLSSVAISFANMIRGKMRAAKLLAPVPGPEGTFLLGFIPELTKNIHRIYDFQTELNIKYGGRTKVPWSIFTNNILYLSDPADVEHVLSTNVSNWVKSDRSIAAMGDVFGKSFLGLNHAHTKDNGAMWRLQRKIVTRVFTTANFKRYTEGVFYDYALRMVELVNTQHGTCEMHQISTQYTMQTTFDILCGVSLESFDKELGLKFLKSLDFVFASLSWRGVKKPYYKYFWWCMPSEYRLQRETKVMTDLVDSILEKRLAESEQEIAKRSDVLSLFITKARELEGEGEGAAVLDIPTLRGVIANLILGGRDTTASTILYSFYSLAQYPEEQNKILDELKTVGTSTHLSYEDLKKLKYLDAFVWETIRLNATVPSIYKQAAEDDVFPDGTFVPAKTEVLMSPYYFGRNNAKLWGDDQLEFRPERWLTMKARPTAYELPVFQGGPRICPGMNMALLEAKVFVAVLLQKFHVKIQDGEQMKDRGYILGPSLVMAGGLPLQLTPRAAPGH